MGHQKKSDDFNRRLAHLFAWATTPPDEPTDEAPPAAPLDEPALAETDVSAFREKAQLEAAILADRVDRAWSLTGDERRQAVSAVCERVREIEALIMALQRYPQSHMRLIQLAFEHWDQLGKDARVGAGFAIRYANLLHPEMIDVIDDATRANSLVARLIYFAVRFNADAAAAFARWESAGVRFARILAQADTWDVRRLAVGWVGVSPHRDAILPLRRALTLPHFVLRSEALTVLHKHFPKAIAPEDVRALLEDAIEHPLLLDESDQANVDAHRDFPALLGKLIGIHRPEGAEALLARLVTFDYRVVYRTCASIDEVWAMGVLAAHYPAFAEKLIDRGARSIDHHQRRDAVEGLVHLPLDLAWPRLLLAAADPIPDLAKRAKDIWVARLGTPCPVNVFSCLQVELLEGPPSDLMRSRIELLRQAPLEARIALVEVLYEEAPSPEALVSLLFALGDPALWGKEPRIGMPRDFDDVARDLVARFGERAILGLTNLAVQYDADNTGSVRGDGSYPEAGVLAALSEIWADGVDFPEAAHPLLRDLAARQIELKTRWPPDEALMILARVGAPPQLVPQLVALAWDPNPKHRDSEPMAIRARALASFALAQSPDDDALDTRILDEMRAARAAGDLPRFALASATGTVRGLVDAIEQTQDVVRTHGPLPEGDLVITDALEACTTQLAVGGDLPPTWIDDALKSPGTHAFVVAARACRKREELSASTRAALDAALDVGGQAATGAAEAALALLHAKAITASDPRLYGVAERAPVFLRAEIVAQLMMEREARELWPLIEGILVNADARTARAFQLSVYMLEQAGLGDDVRALGDRIPHRALRLGAAVSDEADEYDPVPFWVDVPPEPTAVEDEAERERWSATMHARMQAWLNKKEP